MANKETASRFDSKRFTSLKDDLHEVFYRNDNVRNETKNILSEYGIKLVFLNKFDKTPIDGYSFWSFNNPAIGLTLRHKRIDNFAFTIFHELGHIFNHLEKDKTIEFIDLESKVSLKETILEAEADEFAQANLISKTQWKELESLAPLDDQSLLLTRTIKVSCLSCFLMTMRHLPRSVSIRHPDTLLCRLQHSVPG